MDKVILLCYDIEVDAETKGLMNITRQIQIKLWLSVAIITVMVLVGELLGDTEVIFPEIAALTIGGLIAPKQPWRVDRLRMMILMTVSALLGWSISAFLTIPLFFKVMIGLLLCSAVLMISRTTMLPLMSACVLPILIGAKSIVYPISVVVLTGIIIGSQTLLEKTHLRTAEPPFTPITYQPKAEIIRWIGVFLVFGTMAAVATGMNILFIIAPPLVVAFCELSYPDSPARKNPMAIACVIIICACVGVSSRMLICSIGHLPLTLAALVASVIALYVMMLFKKPFPPAGALAILPMIIDENLLMLYPLEVGGSAIVLIALAMLLGKITQCNQTNQKEKK